MSNEFPFNHFINIKSNNFKDLSVQNSFVTDKETHETQESELSTPDDNELNLITKEVLEIIKNNLTIEKYNAFFANTFTVTSLSEDKINITVTTNFIKKMIDQHYKETIKSAINELFGVQMQYSIDVLGLSGINKSTKKVQDSVSSHTFKISEPIVNSAEISTSIENQVLKTSQSRQNSKINPYKTFDNFIVGQSNNMAHAFAISVAKNPGKVYPQLYLYGNSGLGKTHLLHAVCNYINKNQPHLRICMTTANSFMSEMIMAIQDKKDSEFRRKYTELLDVLIIDDIHELKNKTRTQTEFFHIFNELQNRGKQLIFTSDKPPKEIDGVEERIKTRLSSALLTEIQQPDLETRIAILKEKALEKDIYLDDEILSLIASCIKNNIRELEGSLVKLGAYSDLMNVDIDLEIAKEQLGLNPDIEQKVYSVESISKAVSSYYKITIGDLRGKSRIKHITFARHVAMYMIHKILKKTLEEIGDYFSKRDHTSVIHAVNKIEKLSKQDEHLNQQIYEIESTL